MSEINSLLDLNSVYVQEVLKPQLGKEPAAKSSEIKKDDRKESGSNSPTDKTLKRVSQAVYDIRYRAKREEIPVSKAYTQYMQNTTMSGPEKSAIKAKLGEGLEVSEETTETKYQVRVKDKNSGKSYVRMATREKINQLRSNPNIESVEMTEYGSPYEGERKKGEQTAKVKSGKGLDPVGREDKDVDNDGDTDKSDKYLLNRRKAVGKAIAKEEFSNWRTDLFEVDDTKNKEQEHSIKEKKIKNKVIINPEIKEAVEEIGGTLLELIEINEFDNIIESVYNELFEEGYEDGDIESAIEYALTEATVTLGHDTDDEPKAKNKLVSKAKEFLAKTVVKGYNKARNVKRSIEPTVQRAKTSLKRGIKKVALKVADRMKEEVEQIGEQMGNEKDLKKTPEKPTKLPVVATTTPVDKNVEMLNKQKLTNLRVVQQKKQQLERQKLNLQKQGKLPVNMESKEINELNRLEKETGKDLKGKPVVKGGTAKDDKAFQMISKLMGKSRLGATQRGEKKVKGGPTPGPSITPGDKVRNRRAMAQSGRDNMSSRFD
jgi:hypothetical protein